MTVQQAVDWLNSRVGQYWDFDGSWGNQCVDSFNFYYQFLTGRNPYSDGYGVPGAKNLWDVPTNVFTKIPDSASLTPQPGDVIIYDSRWGGGFGHVEMVVAVQADGVWVVGSNFTNDPSRPVQKAFRPWRVINSGIKGVMRPNVFTQGEEIMQTDEDVILAYNNFRQGDTSGFGQPNAQEIAFWKGKPFKAILEAARGGEVKARNAQFEALANFHNVWAPKLDELNTRPTKADLQALKDQATAESAKVAELTQALADEQAKPPQIVTETVTKEITLPFTDKDGVNWLKNLFARIFNRKEK